MVYGKRCGVSRDFFFVFNRCRRLNRACLFIGGPDAVRERGTETVERGNNQSRTVFEGMRARVHIERIGL